jgi:NTE family protein
MSNKAIALVLSGGGARGLAHIGVIEELERRGFTITSVAGTSMGALVGGIYATGQLKLYKDWMCTLDKRGVFDLVDFTVGNGGIIKGVKIIKELKKMVPDRNIEDLDIPFCAVATDINQNREIIFTKGDLYDAIRASISIPTVFIPFKIDGMQLVDGGVLNPIPINRVKRNHGDLLVAVDVNAQIPFKKEISAKEPEKNNHGYHKYLNMAQSRLNNYIPKNKNDQVGYFNLVNKSISLMTHQISQLTIEKYPPDILINVSREAFETYEFYKAQDIIKEGELAVTRFLS